MRLSIGQDFIPAAIIAAGAVYGVDYLIQRSERKRKSRNDRKG